MPMTSLANMEKEKRKKKLGRIGLNPIDWRFEEHLTQISFAQFSSG